MMVRRASIAASLAVAVLTAAAPAAGQRSVAPVAMQRVAPALAGYTDSVLFGDVWKRPALSPRDRSLVTVAILVATGRTAQLEGHAGRALDNGVTPVELSGLVTHLAFYSGWPNAVSSIDVVDRVFRSRRIDTSALRTDAAPLAAPASDRDRARSVDDDVAPTAPELASLTNGVLFGDLWRRSDLSPRDRSLVTIAALAAGGDADQLGFHIRRGLENGLTQAQIGEAMAHLAFYAGWPKAMAAVSVAKRTFAEADRTASAVPLTVVPARAEPARGPASNFTGVVTTDTAYRGTGGSRLGGARVTFRPGARSNWHTHPLGQLLLVTEGRGLVQEEGGPVRVIRPGDAVWIAPGVKHWHGAAPDSMMTHFAVNESVDGKGVDWLEPVTEAQYAQAPTR